MSIQAMKQALEALEMLAKWEHPASNITTKTGRIYPKRIAADAADAIRTAIEQADHSEQNLDMVGATGKKHLQVEQEPLGYWNAVQGWVELPEEEQKPTAWVYPEALEAFRQGKPWTAYGLSGEGYSGSDGIKRIPLYTTPPAAQRHPLTADDMREPKNGDKWRVEWWNESCRMMLPNNMSLEAFQSYKNGTIQFTLKRIAAHGIGEKT